MRGILRLIDDGIEVNPSPIYIVGDGRYEFETLWESHP